MNELLNNLLPLFLVWVAGGVLAAVFFGGLWWTVAIALSSNYSALWLLASLLLRMAIIITGFYIVSAGHWQRLLACLLGFVMVRFVVTRFVVRGLARTEVEQHEHLTKGVSGES